MHHSRRFAAPLFPVLTAVVLAPLAARGAAGARWQGLPLWGGTVQVAAAPRSPEITYAATTGSAGIYRSDDGGSSWQRQSRGLPAHGGVYDLLADPARPGRLYLAMVTFPVEAGGGVYRSDDAGEHWVEISTGLPDDAVVVSLAANPRGADVLYAGTAGRSLYRLTVAD